jgi:hypothetical protein
VYLLSCTLQPTLQAPGCAERQLIPELFIPAIIWYLLCMTLPEVGGAFDTLRTDPAGFACLALGIALPIYAEQRNLSETTQHAAIAAGLGLVTTGMIHIGNMFRYAERIESSLQANSFDEATRFRIRAYCPRQVGYVVCARSGFSEQYQKVCDSTARKRWTFLPHLTESGLSWPSFRQS